MSDKQDNNSSNSDKKNSPRPSSPNPFLSYLSTSPTTNNQSPRSDTSSSPRSPRFQTDFQNGLRIPISNASITNSMLTAASPPRFATIDQFMTAANAAQNMALAHEISVNQDFKLEKLDYNSSRLIDINNKIKQN